MYTSWTVDFSLGGNVNNITTKQLQPRVGSNCFHQVFYSIEITFTRRDWTQWVCYIFGSQVRVSSLVNVSVDEIILWFYLRSLTEKWVFVTKIVLQKPQARDKYNSHKILWGRASILTTSSITALLSHQKMFAKY